MSGRGDAHGRHTADAARPGSAALVAPAPEPGLGYDRVMVTLRPSDTAVALVWLGETALIADLLPVA